MEAKLLRSETVASYSDVIREVSKLESFILEKQPEFCINRRLTSEVLSALKRCGVFRMTAPKAWGGLELDPIEQLKIIEELSRFDACVGWCAKIGNDGGYFSGWIDQQAAKTIFNDIDSATACSLGAMGKAILCDSGYRISGHWVFTSGCHHSDQFVLGCKVYHDGEQQFLPGGVPKTLQCIVPASAVEILDNWHAMGLHGSGSNDVSVKECFVKAEHCFSFQNLTFYRKTPLYRFPLNIALNFSSIAVGVAQRALDEFIALTKRPCRLTVIDGELPPRSSLRDEAFVQDTVGRAACSLNATRLHVYDIVGKVWKYMEKQEQLPASLSAQFQMLNAYTFHTCAEIIQSLHTAFGGGAAYEKHPLARCLRDIQTMCLHMTSSPRSFGMGGRAILGLPPERILM